MVGVLGDAKIFRGEHLLERDDLRALGGGFLDAREGLAEVFRGRVGGGELDEAEGNGVVHEGRN